jgi:hypothetical protein
MIVRQGQPAIERATIKPCETPVSGEAVLGHPMPNPVMNQTVVFEPPNDGKQHRRMTRPDRAGLPKQLNPSLAS